MILKSDKAFTSAFEDQQYIKIIYQLYQSNINYNYYRRSFKVCDKCAYYARSDNMVKSHLESCDFVTEGERAGFLKVGEAPKCNGNFVRQILEKYGCTCQPPPFKAVEKVLQEKEQFLDRM